MNLYKYQQDAVNSTLTATKGIICMPTGTGKTLVQSSIIANDIILKPNEFNIYVVNAPRIVLTYQLLKEIYTHLILNKIECRYAFVHSGGFDDYSDLEEIRIEANEDGLKIPFSEIGSGTSIESIEDILSKAQKQNLPCILLSTYNSADKIELARKKFDKNISIICNDEAHYLIQDRFHDILHTLTSDRCYFFTATRLHTKSDKGRGMNNVELYGELLYNMIPREAIDLGKMIRPRIHIIKTKYARSANDFTKSIPKIIYESFYAHKQVLDDTVKNETRFERILMSPKILISVKGSADILSFLSSKYYLMLKANYVDVFITSSREEIGNQVNGIKMDRLSFLKKLRETGKDKSKKMIVMHYDILAEGVDVSGFTSIMPLRTLSKSKFLQTLGRASRVEENDRAALEIDKRTPLYKLNKPYAYIIIPNITGSDPDDIANLRDSIKELRKYSCLTFEETIVTEIVHGIPEEEDLGNLTDITKPLFNRGEEIDEILSELEDENVASLLTTYGINEDMIHDEFSQIGIEIGELERIIEIERVYSLDEEDLFFDMIANF